MLNLYFMRHGQTTHSDSLRGSLDDDLTDLGFAQMQSAWENFANKANIQAIISSDLIRCQRFAHFLNDKLHLPLQILPELQELHFGDWEGQKVADLYEKYPNELAKFWQTPTTFTPPNAEPLIHFANRIDKGINHIKHFAIQHNLNNILVITHGGVIKYLACKMDNTPLDDILKKEAELGKIYHIDGNKL